MKYEVVEKQTIRKKFKTAEAHIDEYRKHIGYGSSGQYTGKDQIGTISSFLNICLKLEADGYINLKFPNGGDDDILLVDHKHKQFGFFEDVTPAEEQMEASESLSQLWQTYY